MNLLMISLHADPTSPAGIGEGGGTHSYIRELLTYFSSKDINILLITRKNHPSLLEKEIISENCRIHRIIIKDENYIDKKELYALHNITLQKIENLLEKLKYEPDLIHSIYWNSGQVAKELSLKMGIPFVHTVISNGLRRQKAGMQETLAQRFEIEKQIFQSSSYIFCITPSERNDLVKLYQINAKKIIILGRPISKDFLYPSHDDFGIPYRFALDKKDINSKSQLKFESDFIFSGNKSIGKWWTKQAFLYCGRLASNKGVDVVLKAWYQLKIMYRDLCPALWIVGGSLNEIELYKSKLNDEYNFELYEQSGDLIWWGYLDQRGISTLMLKSHALIMHSSYEPGGRVIIEALASGIPVIATFCGFGEDYIYNWYNGFQVPFGNIKLLCHVMSLFVKQPYLSNYLGINAKAYIEKMLKEWDFYESHQLVYTLALTSVDENFQNSGVITFDEYYKNYINIYPYFNNIIICDILQIQLENALHQSILQIEPIFTEVSAVWNAKSSSAEYEIWQPYTKLLNEAYYCSFIDTTVDKRSNQYEREKYASNLMINPVLKYIDSHYIYIKKKYPMLNGAQLDEVSIQIAIKKLLGNCIIFKPENSFNILKVFDREWYNCSIDDIKNVYYEYYRQAPSFLYHSHNINYGLSIRQLYFILTDQNNMITNELLLHYFECEDFLYANNMNYEATYGICLEDCSIENINVDQKKSICMFRNASNLYLGDISRMIADFLHSYLLYLIVNSKIIDSFKKHIDFYNICQNKQLCIGWLFIIIFEKLVLYQNILENEKYKNELELLIKLKEIYMQ